LQKQSKSNWILNQWGRNEQMSIRIEIPKELGEFFKALANTVFVNNGCYYDTAIFFSPFLKHGLGKQKA
jgi:hypothetical protein